VLFRSVLNPYEALVSGLEKAGLEAARRPLRLVPGAMRWELNGEELSLEFELPPGAYATTVLRELVSADTGAISEAE